MQAPFLPSGSATSAGAHHSAPSQRIAPGCPAHLARLQPACGAQGTALLNGSAPGGEHALTPEDARTRVVTAPRQVKGTAQT